MDDRPDGSELLTVARRLLLDELLPLLPAAKSYDVLMVANAMAIAARELKHRSRMQRESDEEIERFLASAGLGHAPERLEMPETRESEETVLARHIRGRTIPPEQYGPLHQLLLSLVEAKLAITNPKHLGGQGGVTPNVATKDSQLKDNNYP